MPFTRINICLVFILAFGWSGKTQDCPSSGIIFDSQDAIDQFHTTYPNCDRIVGNVVIEEKLANDIRDLAGLIYLVTIDGNLVIQNNRSLGTLSGLDNLLKIGAGLTIISNHSLQQLDGLGQLLELGQSVHIENNSELQNLKGLQGLSFINGDLLITDNDQLATMAGLDNLINIGEHLIINSNSGLLNLTGLNRLVSVGDEIFIKDNSNLKTLAGLNALEIITGDLIIDNNPKINSFAGLNALTKIGGNTLLVNNESLIDLNGLQALRQFGGLLQIFNNTSLKSLHGIDSADHLSILELVILESSNLTNCSVQSICKYLSEPANLVTIRSNAEGCQTVAEVLELCPGSGINSQPGVRVNSLFYPNPTMGPVYIRDELLEDAEYTAYDVAGKQSASGPVINNRFDLGVIPSGMYIVELRYTGFSERERIIKME